MTDQINLGLVWASGGGVTPVSTVKYEGGWVAEIPTYQNFNYMVQGLDQNMLHLAESDVFDWQADIAYQANGKTSVAGVTYYCHTAHTNIDPAGDTSESYWSTTPYFGNDISSKIAMGGLEVVSKARAGNVWSGSDFTTTNATALLALNTSGLTDNWLIGNIEGELAAVNVGTNPNPDGRAIGLSEDLTYKLYHEGNKPVVAEVAGAVEEAPVDGRQYARKGATATSGSWVNVTSTSVGLEPPQPAVGAGAGWYNLNDAQLYVDIDDADTSQWVPANPPQIPELTAAATSYDDSASGFGDNVQTALAKAIDSVVTYRTFNSSQDTNGWVPDADTRFMEIVCIGGGGAGGGCDGQGSTTAGAGGGGGAAAFCKVTLHRDQFAASYDLVIGGGGNGGIGNVNGTAGGASIVTASDSSLILVSGGGQGGNGALATSTYLREAGGQGGATTGSVSPVSYTAIAGGPGDMGATYGGRVMAQGSGGAVPQWGASNKTIIATDTGLTQSGHAGIGHGDGGSGGMVEAGTADRSGGDGASGRIAIWQYK